MSRVICLAGVAILLLARPAPAWNSVGHLTIAKLAYDRLSDGEKLKVHQLLKHHPHYELFLAADRPAGVEEPVWVVLRSAVWPDWVRPRDKDPRGPAVTKYHRGEDHYVNVPLIDPKDAAAFAGRTLIDPDTMNLICALKERCNELRARNVCDEDKAVALCWVLHLVGDIHQPLHNVSYFADNAAFRQGDLGGNKFGVKANGKGVKLHALWDDILGEDPRYEDDSPGRQERIYRQAVTLATALCGRELSAAERERLEKNHTFHSWSEEGFELAKTVAYQTGDRGGLLAGVEVRYKQPVPDDAPELGDDYLKRARATAEGQAILAGRRLAERVKQSLSR